VKDTVERLLQMQPTMHGKQLVCHILKLSTKYQSIV